MHDAGHSGLIPAFSPAVVGIMITAAHAGFLHGQPAARFYDLRPVVGVDGVHGIDGQAETAAVVSKQHARGVQIFGGFRVESQAVIQAVQMVNAVMEIAVAELIVTGRAGGRAPDRPQASDPGRRR